MIYFIVNETSRTGKGANAWREVKRLATEAGVDYKAYKTEYEGHATELANRICNMEDDDLCLVVVGGDGTMNEVLNGMEHFDRVRFGMIPTGSGNDFGRGLGLSKSAEENFRMILSCIREGKAFYKPIDIGQVEWDGCQKPRLFGISSGVGMDAIVCKKAMHSKLKKVLNKIHLGKLTYVLITVYTLFSMDTSDAEITYMDENGKIIESKQLPKMIFSAAMNLFAEGGGVPMAPRGNAFDGVLSVCSAYKIPKWRTFFCLPLLMAAKHENLNGFLAGDGATVHMKLSKPMVLHADGEYLGDPTELTFTCLSKKVRMLMK